MNVNDIRWKFELSILKHSNNINSNHICTDINRSNFNGFRVVVWNLRLIPGRLRRRFMWIPHLHFFSIPCVNFQWSIHNDVCRWWWWLYSKWDQECLLLIWVILFLRNSTLIYIVTGYSVIILWLSDCNGLHYTWIAKNYGNVEIATRYRTFPTSFDPTYCCFAALFSLCMLIFWLD